MPTPLNLSWSQLTWQQLCQLWEIKQQYGGNPDVASVAAFLALRHLHVDGKASASDVTGEYIYTLKDKDGKSWTVTPRQLAHYTRQTMTWFLYPYGDPGEKEERDDKGKVVKEHRDAHIGYVSPMRDAMMLPVEYIAVRGLRVLPFGSSSNLKPQCSKFNVQCSMFKVQRTKHFALPAVACNNLTWQQYRALQNIVSQLFSEDITEEQAFELQAKFLANILTPRSFALLDTFGGSIRLRPHYEYRYNADHAERLAKWFEKKMKSENTSLLQKQFPPSLRGRAGVGLLFHICFQTYQTAINYYTLSYPLLFSDSGKKDSLRDALTGEVGTINTIMKYAGYAEQQQVYDSNLPFVLDILNTMTKEAKEIEKMNSKIKRK